MKETYYYHKHSDVVAFKRVEDSNGSWYERTYDENGKQLTFKNSSGFWSERTYDKKGNRLTLKDSSGYYEIKGEFVTKEEFEQFLNPKPCLGKRVIVDGVEYTLS